MLAKLTVLAAQTASFLALIRRQTIGRRRTAPAFGQIRRRDPRSDRVCAWFELLRQILDASAGAG